jgi:hypothetical protein
LFLEASAVISGGSSVDDDLQFADTKAGNGLSVIHDQAQSQTIVLQIRHAGIWNVEYHV